MRILAIALLVLVMRAPAAASEEQAVVTTVQRLFDAMEARDPTAASAVLLSKGGYFFVREKGGEVSVGGVSYGEFAARLGKDKEPIREVMRDPKVLLHGRVATLWTPYEFHRGGKLSHCGVDSFHLLKTADGWKIAGFVYTVEPCDPRR
ncbi:MAG TPA: hypothetical protein VN442_26860 [Bryobacteraceae bacterium]|nr:hypothetical protein [Bryobacteraceae bacterium]